MRKLWVDGKFIEGEGDVGQAIDPSNEEVIGEFIRGTRAEAEKAINAASAAFPSWRRVPTGERVEMLHEIARRLRLKHEEIAHDLSLETGRSIRKNLGYVEWSAQCFDYYAELARHYRGRVIPSPEGSQLSLVLKVPLGVIGAIIPWNYPLLLLVWKLAPALAAGNTVVVKPASYTTWVSLGFTSLFDHLPPGAVNFISGSGKEVGEYLVTHPAVQMIAFTGSTEVGQRIMRLAADDLKHVHLELGGKDPLIVCADCDLEAAVKAAAWAGFLNAGQVCTSVERVYAENPIYEQFLEGVVDLTSKLVVGPGIDQLSEVTPMIRAEERDKVEQQVVAARAGGAQILHGGQIPADKTKGYYYEPTVITGVT
jgi:acyl-CoA reductase-like NAD-dependent aldehyde dehydrogenase